MKTRVPSEFLELHLPVPTEPEPRREQKPRAEPSSNVDFELPSADPDEYYVS